MSWNSDLRNSPLSGEAIQYDLAFQGQIWRCRVQYSCKRCQTVWAYMHSPAASLVQQTEWLRNYLHTYRSACVIVVYRPRINIYFPTYFNMYNPARSAYKRRFLNLSIYQSFPFQDHWNFWVLSFSLLQRVILYLISKRYTRTIFPESMICKMELKEHFFNSSEGKAQLLPITSEKLCYQVR